VRKEDITDFVEAIRRSDKARWEQDQEKQVMEQRLMVRPAWTKRCRPYDCTAIGSNGLARPGRGLNGFKPSERL
jgi:hypothetical protein